MGLFDKKFCDICGEKIGLLGNRKLEDGNMCKDCAKKLSPFFSDRRSSTIDEIKQQLAYREQNKVALKSFRPNLTFGDGKKIYVDMANGNFVVSNYSPNNWDDENPDVMALSSIMSCNLKIDEDKDEIYTQGKDGQRVSYNPPRYKFYYNFILEFAVNNPYFDDFRVQLNTFRVEGMGTMEYNKYQQMAMEVINTLTPGRGGAMPNMMNGGMPMNQGFAPANAYGQPNPYAQQNPYGQPQANPYAQQNPYGQPQANPYAQQNPYAQPQQANPYAQQNAYAQQPQQAPVAQGWICPACNATNESGAFCACCGTPKAN